jgi:hypothetical protein
MQFSKKTLPTFTQLELISHGLKSIKVNFNIFPGHRSHQILTPLNRRDQFSGLQ